MKKKNLSLNIAVFGLHLCAKDEKMYEMMDKVPGLIRACIMMVEDHLKETGLLDESLKKVAEIGHSVDYSNCKSKKDTMVAFTKALCDAMQKNLKEGD